MKKFIAVVCLTLLSGCSEKDIAEASSDRLDNLTYFKDTRTGLCFAGRHIGSNYGYLTNVPCSSEVEKSAIEFKSRQPNWK